MELVVQCPCVRIVVISFGEGRVFQLSPWLSRLTLRALRMVFGAQWATVQL